EAVDLAWDDVRVQDGLVDAEGRVRGLVRVVGARVRAAGRGRSRGVGRDVRGRARGCARAGAAALVLERLGAGLGLQRRALLGVRDLVDRRLVDVEVGVHAGLGLAGSERGREQRVDLRAELV